MGKIGQKGENMEVFSEKKIDLLMNKHIKSVKSSFIKSVKIFMYGSFLMVKKMV